MICLICMPSALGHAALGLWVYILGKCLVLMLQLLYVTWAGGMVNMLRDITVVSVGLVLRTYKHTMTTVAMELFVYSVNV